MQTLIVGPLGAPELLIILAIVVVLFGATRIGDIGKGIGRGIREFRQELKDDSPEEKKEEEKVESTTAVSSSTPDDKPTSQTH